MTLARLSIATLILAVLPISALLADVPSEAKVIDFVRSIERTVSSGDGKFFDSRFDLNRLMDKVTEDVDVPEKFEAGFRKGFTGNPSQRLGAAIATSVIDENGRYTFLRLKRDPLRAVFRLSSTQGLNYHELHLRGAADGELFFDDVYVYLSGELFSETVRRIYVAVAAQKNRGLLERLIGVDHDYYRYLPEIQRMGLAVRKRDPDQAMSIYNELPESLKNRKEVLIIRLQAAIGLNERELVEATEAFQRAFPKDPALDLVLIDYQFVEQQWEELRKTIDRLDEQVGGDPYLDVIRANVLAARGDRNSAKTALLRVIDEDPSLEDAWVALVDVALGLEDFELTARTLSRLERDFGYQWPDLSEVSEFSAFCDSSAYQAWMRRPR